MADNRQIETGERQSGAILSPTERQLHQTMAPRRQTSFFAGRWTAKTALSQLVGMAELPAIEITSGVFGQPVVHGARLAGMAVSLSHTARYTAAIAFPAEHPLGIDVESLSEISKGGLAEQFGAEELAQVASAGLTSGAALGVMWTAKEALGKVLTCGFTTPLETLAIASCRILEENFFELHYRNFLQYRCLCWRVNDSLAALALPGRTQVQDLREFWAVALN